VAAGNAGNRGAHAAVVHVVVHAHNMLPAAIPKMKEALDEPVNIIQYRRPLGLPTATLAVKNDDRSTAADIAQGFLM
jgi:hypothetical protein